MFDFFEEVIEFLQQVAKVFNWNINFIQQVINRFSEATEQFQPVLRNAPPNLVSLLILLVVGLVFDFVRGR